MIGTSSQTGKALSELEHIRQSITDIITTPIGSRLMRRDYGALVFELIDQPLTGAVLLQLYVCVYDAVTRWERRVDMQSMTIERESGGQVQLRIELMHRSGERYTDHIEIRGAS